MGYLISQLWFCLLIAALLGALIGWILRGLCSCSSDQDTGLQGKLDACNAKVAKLEKMNGDLAKKTTSSAKPARKPMKPKPAAKASTTPAKFVSGSTASDAKPAAIMSSRPSKVDDLKRIKGVGVVLEKTLNDLGIYQFAQVAKFDKKTIAWVDERLKFKGRIERDNWVKQAAGLRDE